MRARLSHCGWDSGADCLPGYGTEPERFEPNLLDLSSEAANGVGLRGFPRTDDACELLADEVQCGSIVRGVSCIQLALANEAVIGGAALGLAVVMRAVAAGKKAQAVERGQFSGNYRIAQTLLEPADGACADSGHHYPREPGLAKDQVETPFAPQDEQ